MLVRTDDEVYRIDAVWLGPPRATFPWRARYVSYGVGLLIMMLIMFVQRRLGVPLDFFSVAWSLVGTVAVTRLLGKKITYERPFGQVVAQFWSEVTGPRMRTGSVGGALRAAHVRVRATRGRPPAPRRGRKRSERPAAPVPVAASSRPARGRGGAAPVRAAPVRVAPARVEPPQAAWASRRSRAPVPDRSTGRARRAAAKAEKRAEKKATKGAPRGRA